MRWLVAIAVCIAALAGAAYADDQLKPEEVRQKYDETLVQLRAAQDRKAELAQENQKLAAKVAELEKQLNQSRSQMDSLQREWLSLTDAAYYWRMHYLAWTAFLDRFPAVQSQWQWYQDSSLPAPITPQWHDANWPYSSLAVDAI